MIKGSFWKIWKKKSPHFEEKSFEITHIFGGFGQT
jgi:hypothetical protein